MSDAPQDDALTRLISSLDHEDLEQAARWLRRRAVRIYEGPPKNGPTWHTVPVAKNVSDFLSVGGHGHYALDRPNLFVLIGAICFHDICKTARTDHADASTEDVFTPQPMGPATCGKDEHARKSAQYVTDHWAFCGFETSFLAQRVADVIERHHSPVDDYRNLWSSVPIPEYADLPGSVNIVPLIALLQVCDEMHNSYERIASDASGTESQRAQFGATWYSPPDQQVTFQFDEGEVLSYERGIAVAEGLARFLWERRTLLEAAGITPPRTLLAVCLPGTRTPVEIRLDTSSEPEAPRLEARPVGVSIPATSEVPAPSTPNTQISRVLELAAGYQWCEFASHETLIERDVTGLRLDATYDTTEVHRPQELEQLALRIRECIKAGEFDRGRTSRTFNAPRYCLKGVVCHPDERHEGDACLLCTGPADYADYLATNGWYADVSERVGFEGSPVVMDYFAADAHEPQKIMEMGLFNSLGMNLVIIVLEDDMPWTYIVRRSKSVLESAKRRNVSVVEGARRACLDTQYLEWHLYDQASVSDPTPAISSRFFRRAIWEECGYTWSRPDLRPPHGLLSFGYDTYRWQPNILGYAILPLTRDELESGVQIIAPGHTEIGGVEWVPLEPDSLAEAIAHRRAMAPDAENPYASEAVQPWGEMALICTALAYYQLPDLAGGPRSPHEIWRPFHEAGLVKVVSEGSA